MEQAERGSQQQALEPIEQKSILFHGEHIIAVKLADGRICVVLRWICEILSLRPQPQLESNKAMTGLIPEILERLGPEHQRNDYQIDIC